MEKFNFMPLSFETRYLIECPKAEIRERLHANWHDACTPVINIFIPFGNGRQAINQLTHCNRTIDVRYISIACEIAVKNRFAAQSGNNQSRWEYRVIISHTDCRYVNVHQVPVRRV